MPSAPSTPRGWRNTAAGVQSSPGSESEALSTVHSNYSGSETHDSSARCEDDTTASSLLAPLAPSAPPSALHRRLGDLRVALRSSLGREAAVQAQLRTVTWQAAEAAGEVTVVKAALCALESADALSKNGRLHDGTLDCLRGALLAHATQQCREHAQAAATAAGDALRAGSLVQEVQAARHAEAQAAASEIAALAEELATARATAQVHAHAAKEAALAAAADAQRAITADAAAASATLAAAEATRACEAAMQREAAAALSRDLALAAAAEANARAEWAEVRAAALEASTTGASGLTAPAASSGYTASSYDAQLRQLRAQASAERERLETALAAALRGEKPAGWSAKPVSCDAQAQTEDVEVVDEEKEQLRGSVHDLCEAVETAHGKIAALEAQLADAQRGSHRAALDAAADAETRANSAWAARLGAAEAAAAMQLSRLSAALAQAQTAAALQQAVPRVDAGQQTDVGDSAAASQGDNTGEFKILRPAARPPPPLPPPAGVSSPAVEAVTSPATPAAAVAPVTAAPKSAVRAQLEAVAVATAAAGADLAASRAALAQLWTLLPSATKSAAGDDVAVAEVVGGDDATTTPAPRARKGLLWSAAQTPESGTSVAKLGSSMTPKAPWAGHDDSPVSVLSPSALFGAGALRGSAAALAVARAQEAAVAALGR